jgi:hypothetical protein
VLALTPVAANGAPPCPDERAATDAVPERATTVVELDPAAIARAVPWEAIEAGLRTDESADALARLGDACGIRFEDLRGLWLAADEDGSTLAVFDGPGIARREVVACIGRQLASTRDGAASWTVSREACVRRHDLGGEVVLIAAGDHLLVRATGPWREEVVTRLALAPSHAPAATTEPRPLARATSRRAVHEDDGSALARIERIAATVSPGPRHVLRVELEVAEAADAATTRRRLLDAIDRLGRDLATDGARPAPLQRVAIGIRGRHVVFEIGADDGELRELVRTFRARARGRAAF